MRAKPGLLSAWLAAITVLLAACSGYPTEDAQSPNPYDVDNPERLRMLDKLGAKAYRAERTRFALDEACTLRVTRDSKAAGAQRFEQVLTPELEVDIRFDKTLRVFELHLLSGHGPDARRLGLLLRSADWMQATKADLLVQLMIRDCQRPAEAREDGQVA